MTENKKLSKMVNHLIKLYFLSERDELIYGDSFVEFGERSMNVLNPSDKIVQNLDKEVIQTSRVADKDVKGKGLLEPREKSK